MCAQFFLWSFAELGYKCTCVRIYTWIYTYACTQIYLHPYVCSCEYTEAKTCILSVRMYIIMHTYVHIHRFTGARTYVCTIDIIMYMCTDLHTYMYISCTHICTHMYICMYIVHTDLFVVSLGWPAWKIDTEVFSCTGWWESPSPPTTAENVWKTVLPINVRSWPEVCGCMFILLGVGICYGTYIYMYVQGYVHANMHACKYAYMQICVHANTST